MHRKRAHELRPGYRNYLLAVFEDGKPSIEFGSWMKQPQARAAGPFGIAGSCDSLPP
jgi:hypothetical protein